MTLADLVSDSYLAYRGKLANVPAAGTEKYNRIVRIANRKQREWALDANVDWPSLYDYRQLGTVSTGVQEYDLDDDVIRVSDYVTLTDSSNNNKRIEVIKPQTITEYVAGCYVHGTNPKQLTFLTPITAALSGRSLYVPCFAMPPDLVNPTDVVTADNPEWLIYAIAAELARNDYSKVDQFGNLNGIAMNLYSQMVTEAESSSFLQPNGVTNNMPQSSVFYGNYLNNPWGN